jgi:hypothetical protein
VSTLVVWRCVGGGGLLDEPVGDDRGLGGEALDDRRGGGEVLVLGEVEEFAAHGAFGGGECEWHVGAPRCGGWAVRHL